MKNVSNSSYQEDGRHFFSEFLDVMLEKKKESKDIEKEKYKYKQKQTVCPICISAAGSLQSSESPFASLTRYKCYGDETLFFINDSVFFIIGMEVIFRSYYDSVWKLDIDLNQFYTSKMRKINFLLPECHKLHEKIIKKFVSFRIKSMCGVNTTGINPEFMQASKSMAMHLTIN